MKILSAAQMKQADIATIANQHISTWELMERASTVLFHQLINDFGDFHGFFSIFCGAGNNGGDGLALARLLYIAGFQVEVFLSTNDSYSQDNQINQDQLASLPVNITKFDRSTLLQVSADAIIIDCLFGYGLSRPLDTSWQAFILQINNSPHTVVSVDLPSGLLADQHTDQRHPIVKADITYTFQCPKIALLLPESATFVGKLRILDIQLDDDAIEGISSDFNYLEIEDI